MKRWMKRTSPTSTAPMKEPRQRLLALTEAPRVIPPRVVVVVAVAAVAVRAVVERAVAVDSPLNHQ